MDFFVGAVPLRFAHLDRKFGSIFLIFLQDLLYCISFEACGSDVGGGGAITCIAIEVLRSDLAEPTKSSIPLETVNSYQTCTESIEHLLVHCLATATHCIGQVGSRVVPKLLRRSTICSTSWIA